MDKETQTWYEATLNCESWNTNTTDFYKIEELEIEKETSKFVFLKDGSRRRKNYDGCIYASFIRKTKLELAVAMKNHMRSRQHNLSKEFDTLSTRIKEVDRLINSVQ